MQVKYTVELLSKWADYEYYGGDDNNDHNHHNHKEYNILFFLFLLFFFGRKRGAQLSSRLS